MDTDKKMIIRIRGIIVCNDKLLVVKQAHDTSFCALPGGHLEWGEDIKECLKRELAEELGVKPEIGRLLYVNNFTDKNATQSIEFFFEITNSNEFKNPQNVVRTHEHEIAEICWVGPNENIPLLPKEVWEDFKKGDILSNQVKFIN